MAGAPVLLFACGDVMTGRGVDQVLPYPGGPQLREVYADDARAYVRLAERANGPIPQPVSFAWPWGDALQVLDAMAPDVRLINLETAVTSQADFAPGKAVHYRMSPRNLPCVAAVRPDVCALANNHVLDFGRAGLAETLDALDRAGLTAAGAGRDAAAAWQPAAVPLPGGGRVLVFSCGAASSGIPPDWAAATGRLGVSYLPSLSGPVADTLIARAEAARQDGDLVVVSIHWGANWGYDVPADQVRFAHQLVDGGISLIHGHSSHHPRPAEVYRGRLILYGCGDCIDDYEGIGGYEEFRDELRLLYFASLTPGTGTLRALRMVPMRARKMRLQRAGPADSGWLAQTLSRVSRGFGSQIEQQPDGTLLLRAASVPGPGTCGPLPSGIAVSHADHMKGWFAHRDTPDPGALDDELPGLPHIAADRACCCPARPVVTVIMPPAPGRPYPVDLLLCSHHFQVSRAALQAAGAAVYDDTGALILGGARGRPPAPVEPAAA